MNDPRPFDAFGEVPATVAPSKPVRYWHHATLAGAFVFTTSYLGLLALGWSIPNPDGQLIRFWDAWRGGLVTAFHLATATIALPDQAVSFFKLVSIHHPLATWARIGAALIGAGTLATLVFVKAAAPRSNTWHVSGQRLLEGKEALKEARHRSLTPEEAKRDPFALALHPALVLPKKHWSRHVWITGSVGSGKSVVLKGIVAQIVGLKRAKLFLYDVKGDYTSIFKRPILVSPFDRRSHAWDVAKDVRTPTHAAAFASSLIPEADGNGKFWTLAAQDLLIGCVRELQNTAPEAWGWPDLARLLRRPAAAMFDGMRVHYPRAATLVANAESQTTASILSTLGGFTRLVDDLAMAWPNDTPKTFSMSDWVRDDSTSRRQIIVQSGGDAALTKAYISAMINTAIPDVIGPALPDDEQGRGLYFVFDELTSMGRLNIDSLLDKGRSKGVVAIMAVQDLAQVELVYGGLVAQAFSSMVATKIICQVQSGATRDKAADSLGKRRVAWRTHDKAATLHEENRPLITSPELTERLGFRKGKRFGPEGWGIRAIVDIGGNPMLLDFPGVTHSQKRPGQVPALWTTRPAGPMRGNDVAVLPEPGSGRSLDLTAEEIDALFSR